jgi:hypothetical protein
MKNLKQINSVALKLHQEDLPEVTLESGERVQTGTVAAFLKNCNLYNTLVSESARSRVAKDIERAIPTLAAIGLFDLFPPEDWASTDNPARDFVGKLLERASWI